MYSNTFLDQKRLETDPQAEACIATIFETKALQQAFWQFLGDWENNTLPAEIEGIVRQHLPNFDAPLTHLSPAEERQSGRFFEQYSEPIFLLLGAYSLPYCYAGEAGVQVLFQTQRLRKQALKRLQETGLFVFNVAESGAFDPILGKAWISILRVRLMHAAVRIKLQQYTDWEESSRWGKPINQEDLAATLFSFSLLIILGLRKLGYEIPETLAQVYFKRWNEIGARLGIAQEMRPDTIGQSLALIKAIERRQMRPSEAGQVLTRTLIDETEKTTDGQLPRGFIASLTRHLMGPKLAGYVGIHDSNWTSPLIELAFFRQKYAASTRPLTDYELRSHYQNVKKRLTTLDRFTGRDQGKETVEI